jgi:hypothetical protein
MPLIERSETMPSQAPGRIIVARTRQGDLIELKNGKLSLGERLMGRYGPFWRIDTRPQQHRQAMKVRSRTGRLNFDVDVRVTFSLDPGSVEKLLDVADPVAEFLVPMLEAEARAEGRKFAIQDYEVFGDALTAALDPRRSVVWRDLPIRILTVQIDADMPPDIVSVDEQRAMLEGLDGRIALAEMKGDTEAARRMRNAADAMREFVRRKAEDVSFKADEIIAMQHKINAMVDLGYGDEPVVRSIRAQLTEMAGRTADGAATPGEAPGGDGRSRRAALDQDPMDAD